MKPHTLFAYYREIPDPDYPDQVPPRGRVILKNDRTHGAYEETWYTTETLPAARRAANHYQRDRDARNRRIDKIRRSIWVGGETEE